MTELTSYSASEMMIVAAARALAGARVVFVGVGLPNAACNLARRTVAPELELVYEAGVYGARPARLPLSVGDPTLVSGALAAMSMAHLFQYYLQRGLIDVGFLGAAQIDRFGNLNSTVIGDYARPKVRLPGSGGACEIALLARRIFVITRLSKRTFVEKLDFRTSPGHLTGGDSRAGLRAPGCGPEVVITDRAIFRFDPASCTMALTGLYPGCTIEQVQAQVAWPLDVASHVAAMPPPAAHELAILRNELDTTGRFRT